MVDLDQPVTVKDTGGVPLFEGRATRTIRTLASTLTDRQDPQLVYSAEVRAQL